MFDEPCRIEFAVELGRWDVNSDFWTLENLLNLNEIAAKSQKRSPLTSADDDRRQRNATTEGDVAHHGILKGILKSVHVKFENVIFVFEFTLSDTSTMCEDKKSRWALMDEKKRRIDASTKEQSI